MYRPHSSICECLGVLEPAQELTWRYTQPNPKTRMTFIKMLCPKCMVLKDYQYMLPHMQRDVVKNVLRDINDQVGRIHEYVLVPPITLNTSKDYEEFGVQFSLGYLLAKGLIHRVDTATNTFKLTVHGWITILHAPY